MPEPVDQLARLQSFARSTRAIPPNVSRDDVAALLERYGRLREALILIRRFAICDIKHVGPSLMCDVDDVSRAALADCPPLKE